MNDWLTKLIVGEGNVVLERSYTNWNTLDVESIVREKEEEAKEAAALRAARETTAQSKPASNANRQQ